MKIIIDIGHPAHVHYFRTFISIMKSKGHNFLIIARDKEVVFDLLSYYDLPYISRGTGRTGLVGKITYLPKAVLFIISKALKFKPDIFLSFGSPYSAQASWFLRKPHIAFDDTDHAPFEHIMYVPFTRVILTPESYMKNFGSKHIRFDSYMELCSLHPKYISFSNLNLENNVFDFKSHYVVIRLVSWQASHDRGLKGFSQMAVKKLIKELSQIGNVIISSETDLPKEFERYRYKLHPSMMHYLLYNASLFISESLTMSAEAAFLGTPALCISSATAGVTNEQIKAGLYSKYENEDDLIQEAISIFSNPSYKIEFADKNRILLQQKIDLTAFMVWFIENYPESFHIMKKNPDYQFDFR